MTSPHSVFIGVLMLCSLVVGCDGEIPDPDPKPDPVYPVCEANERVVNHACEPCAQGSNNPAGDDATGHDA